MSDAATEVIYMPPEGEEILESKTCHSLSGQGIPANGRLYQFSRKAA